MPSIERGSVWLVDLGYTAKTRPALVISIPFGDADRALYVVIPHTTEVRDTAYEIAVNARFLQPGVFDTQQYFTIPSTRFIKFLGRITIDEFEMIQSRVKTWLGLS